MNKIGIYEFSGLEENQKKELVYQEGDLITSIEFEGIKKLLYTISDFFVEISFNDKGIISINQFKKGSEFDKYLTQIELKDLEN